MGRSTLYHVVLMSMILSYEVTAEDINIKISPSCEANKTMPDYLQGIHLQLMQHYQLLRQIFDAQTEPKPLPQDCYELYERGNTKSGIYTIHPSLYPVPFPVYCDMDTDGGGWTVYQRRMDGTIKFERGWEDYKNGFGNANTEFWLGNEKLHFLTSQKEYECRIDLTDFEGEHRYAKYNKFRLGDESFFFKLILGSYTGDAGDSFTGRNQAFSTFDADHDIHTSNCAATYKGAWWYDECHYSNLNGIYHAGEHESYADGVNWYGWKGYYYSLKKTELKVRPVTA